MITERLKTNNCVLIIAPAWWTELSISVIKSKFIVSAIQSSYQHARKQKNMFNMENLKYTLNIRAYYIRIHDYYLLITIQILFPWISRAWWDKAVFLATQESHTFNDICTLELFQDQLEQCRKTCLKMAIKEGGSWAYRGSITCGRP